MLQRTWEYGSTLKGDVLEVGGSLVAVGDELGEGHILKGVDHDIEPKKGDKVIMRFCKGGPTGGYWKITALAEAA